ncbi:MAG: hypothetical protein JJE45_01460 [Prolixibacteraceae bacterium]|nr:hypothetical protein [Prolixibacteraceae bacterium]
MVISVIDLGTNTCNLLIAEIASEGKVGHIFYQGSEAVRIGEGGINKGILTKGAFKRAETALLNHIERIKKYSSEEIFAYATSAVRDASNRNEFYKYIKEKTGISLQIISGEREAELIFKGVNFAFGKIPDNSLILDIGGGSNEYIFTFGNQILWKESFPLGMSRVLQKFDISDPITKDEIAEIKEFFLIGHKDLFDNLKWKPVNQLIGCSGAFDTIADLKDGVSAGSVYRITEEIFLSEFVIIYKRIIESTISQRKKMIEMSPFREKMIIPSIILMKFILESFHIKRIIHTGFSLREGVWEELTKRKENV